VPIPYKLCVNDVHFIARVQPYAALIYRCVSIGLQIHGKLDAKIQAIIDEHRAARTMTAGSRAPESLKKDMDFVDVLEARVAWLRWGEAYRRCHYQGSHSRKRTLHYNPSAIDLGICSLIVHSRQDEFMPLIAFFRLTG
jgi:hypothetical protein